MTTDTGETCSHCKIALAPGGRRPSVVEERFCMARACQAVRQRRYRAKARSGSEELPKEIRPCFCCGDVLMPRSGRITDSLVGRWCPKTACQSDRRERLLLKAVAEDMKNGLPVSMTTTEIMSLSGRLMFRKAEKGRIRCDECGRHDAIPGYPHPRPDGSPGLCKALGNHVSTPGDIAHFFPADTME